MEPILAKYVELQNWLASEEGQTLAEYGLILALIAVVCVAAITLLGTSISTMLSGLGGAINGTPAGG